MPRLTGRTLLLTRSAEDADEWARALADEGALSILLPCISTELLDEPDLGPRLASAANRADWIVFTSRRGVEAFVELTGSSPPPSARLAAVAESTAEHLRQRFGRADRVGGGTAKALAAGLAEDPAISDGADVLLVLAANAGPVLERTLSDAGANVTRVDVYRTRPAEPVATKRDLSTLGCDAVIFASPTAVTGFDNQVNVDKAGPFVTIGPSTSAAVRAHDWPVAAEAREPSLEGLVESLLETHHV